MKRISLFLAGAILGMLISCSKDNNDKSDNISLVPPEIHSFSGKVQKGPYITGTSIIMNELKPDLGQTGRSFTSTITNDDGSFDYSNISLEYNYALLTANGFYFSELYGELSPASLTLQAVVDVASNDNININVLTHLTKGRIENLMEGSLGFQQAYESAQSDMLFFLGVTEPFDSRFEELDISKDDEDNAVLLAFSVILQRYTNMMNEKPYLTAELTELLTNLSNDFAPDGYITEQSLIDTLMYNISQLNLIDIRNNIEERYSSLGLTTTIPEFEYYVAKFQEKYSQVLVPDFIYPDSASPDPMNFPEAKIINALYPEYTNFESGSYSVAAISPLYETLTLNFLFDNSNYSIGGPIYGWEFIDNYPEGFTLVSQRQNELMSMLLHLEFSGSATIEYFENDTITPAFVKQIQWE